MSYKQIILISFVAALLLCASARADDPASLTERLHRAQMVSSLDEPGIAPWHLKLAITLLDPKGNPVEEGTIEEWWFAHDHWKINYSTPSFTMTQVNTTSGYFRTAGTSAPPMLLDLLLQQVVHPMPADSEINDAKPDLRKETFGKATLDCIMLDQPLKNVPYPPLGLFPTYCFDPGKDSLRVSFDFGSQYIVRNKTGSFQNHFVPMDTSVSVANVLMATARILSLSGMVASSPEFDNTSLKPISNQAAKVAGGVMQGQALKKVPPVYPEEAKRKHIDGTVVLHAIIGRDGHVHSLRFISLPDSSLGIAAVAAVRQWTYKPYLLNGEPTEVDTTITVNFKFGPG